MLSLIYFNYRLPFPVTSHYLNSISSYLVSSNSQHKVTIIVLRQAIYYTSLSNAGGTWAGIDNHRCSLLFWFWSTIPHSILIRLLGCVYYSCSQHLSRTGSSYQCIKTDQNKSGSYLDLHAAVTTHEQYNILYLLQCYNSTKYWLYKVIYNNT